MRMYYVVLRTIPYPLDPNGWVVPIDTALRWVELVYVPNLERGSERLGSVSLLDMHTLTVQVAQHHRCSGILEALLDATLPHTLLAVAHQ